ncbi:MAG: YicC/YloC family endoribonuclease [Bacillota bacterium]|nr:YicC family protein [Clostridiales bacterium]MDD6765052.1 YicC family protein [Bacillota bacterium]MDY5606425.1 YicC/YloC family endoribonuclease [Lentihominibacter sp.]MDD6979039.1 YicC family protein [Bacillota bacterium]MDD7130108.1 YicC family protein [Bacillota bacterium]
MIRSMTGFGRGEYSDGKRNVICEIRTVNHRYADISVKMPKRYSFAEEKIKALIKERVRRGKVEVSIIVENLTEGDITIRLNSPVAQQYIENLKELKERYGLTGEIDLKLVSSMPDVLKAIPDVEDEEEVTAVICESVKAAVSRLDEMRTTEGAKLAEDLLMRGELIREIVKKIEKRAPLVAEEYREKLEARIRELVEDKVDIPADRILVEAAVFADKANITEELVRLDSHMIQLKAFLTESGEGTVGKKLDFLVQEMNREANTIGSKANDLEITSLMLETKSEIEKIREQVQNIE